MYQALGSYFQLAVGSGKEELFNFNLGEFCNRYKTNISQVLNSLKYLEKEGYISVSESVFEASKLKFIVGQADLQHYQENNSTLANFIKVILRSYSGVFDNYKVINEDDIAKRAGMTYQQSKNLLVLLMKQKVIDYIPQNNDPKIYYNEERLSDQNLILSKKNYDDRKKVAIERMDAVINYVTHSTMCRSKLLLSYFGEANTEVCGNCDTCLKNKRDADSNAEFDAHCKSIRTTLETPQPLDQILINTPQFSEKQLIKTIRFLMDNDRIVEAGNKLYWNE
jgi:ATP-dependent DNA helicase RecQ